MAGITNDTGGQWIVLCGLTISLSLTVLAVLANQASITGYYSSCSVLEFPKEQIRELMMDTLDYTKTAAEIAWELNHTSNETVLLNFTRLLNNYSSQVSTIHSAYGNTVNISISKTVFNSTNNSRIDIVWLNIYYDDGTTYYASEPEIIEVKQ